MAEAMDIDQRLNSSLDDLVQRSKRANGEQRGPEGGRRGGRRGGGGGGGGSDGRRSGSGQKRERDFAGGSQTIRVARRIYVGNLSFRTGWPELKDYFRQVGHVVYANVLRDARGEGRSKGCGIVEFETAEEAAEAINTLHLTQLDGREIYVREDREDAELKEATGAGPAPGLALDHDVGAAPGFDSYPEHRVAGGRGPGGAPVPKRGRGEGGSGGGGGGVVSVSEGPVVGRRVYVNNLAVTTSWQTLKDHFRTAGNVVHADVLMDPDLRSKGCGIVEFDDPAAALHAIDTLSHTMLDGHEIIVREDREDRALPAAAAQGQGLGHLVRARARVPGARHAWGPLTWSIPKVVVQGLPYAAEWQELKDLVRGYGPVLRADIMKTTDGRSRGFGTVLFESPADAQRCIQELNGQDFEGRVITVKLDRFA